MFGLGGLMGGMGGLGGMMGGAGGAAGAAGGAAGGAGGFMGTLGKIGKGLGTAAQTFSSMGGFTGEGQQGQRPVGGWNGGQDTSLQDEIKKQLELMKQERIMQDLARYQPYDDRGGISGLTINPYK